MTPGPVDLSVVIPTFDRSAMLGEALASVLAQSRPPREIVVIDNGRASAEAVVRAYGDRVRYHRQEPRGVQVARNTGIGLAASTWVSLLDDDDLYAPDLLEHCAAAMADDRADIVCADHRKFDSGGPHALTNFESAPPGFWDGVLDPGFTGRFPVERLLRFIPFYPSQMMFRRDLALRIGGFDPALRGVVAEDVDFLVRLLGAGRLAIVPRPLVRYRVHDANDSRGWDEQAWGRWTVFEGLRAKPGVDPAFLRALDDTLPHRRPRAFDAAFGTRRFAEARALYGLLRPSDRSAKRRAKAALARAGSLAGRRSPTP